MKTRFNTYDIVCGVTELQKLVGQRVNQIYDVDNKTYLIRFQGGSEKSTLLIESGVRFHTTSFEWPKNVAPSGFSMKLRKHLKNKRLESLRQLGGDRIVDLQFGSAEAAYHIIVELYDRGNIILTDHELTILYILRPHTEGEKLRFAVREKYPEDRAKVRTQLPSKEELKERLKSSKHGDSLYYFVMDIVDCGPAVIEHVLTKYNLNNCVFKSENEGDNSAEAGNNKKKNRKNKKQTANTRIFDLEKDFDNFYKAIEEADSMVTEATITVSRGYIIKKKEEKVSIDGKEPAAVFYQNLEYHPCLFKQYEGQPVGEFDSFMMAVDEFYSTLEGQRIDMKILQQEREVLNKLINVKQDHAKRLDDLIKKQDLDKRKAELITCNQALVEKAILAIRTSLANQMTWDAIDALVQAAQASGDPVASAIKQLKLEINHITLLLSDSHQEFDFEEEDDGVVKSMLIDIDLSLGAWANACKYYDKKRYAAKKEQKTIDASEKALKSAERKTQQTLKDVRTVSAISKARKVYWFEKFFWFISSENYLVIGGRDAQQNELIVKRYMRPSDIYVHAEIQGASSVVIRNQSTEPIPPKTLVEAGTMAISYSVAWDAKVITNAYWVHSNQVSKTAPSGEYLGTGSFMIRGKKNFLPNCNLIMGLSLLFKLDESCVEAHIGERKVRTFEEEMLSNSKGLPSESETVEDNEVELQSDSEGETDKKEEMKTEIEAVEENSFPDTEIKIDHNTGLVHVKTGLESVTEGISDLDIIDKTKVIDNDETIIIAAAPTKKKLQQNSKKRKEEKSKQKQEQQLKQELQKAINNNKNPAQLNRGQRRKLKKMKNKYDDQDFEERELRLNILQSANIPAKKIDNEENNEINTEVKKVTFKEPEDHKQKEQKQNQNEKPEADEADEADEIPLAADVELLDTLTGQPLENDELLFVIPVVAPYQALQSYKYKVKLTPGTGKRGRAAKTALMMFSKEKSCTPREKDLLKSIKDEAMARNIPGKVKLSTPQLQKYKK